MSVHRFSVDTLVYWENQTWRITRRLSQSQVNLEDTKTLETKTVGFKQLHEALFAGDLRFLANPKRAVDANLENIEHGRLLFEDYDITLQAIAYYRLSSIEPLLMMSTCTREDVKNHVKAIQILIEKGILPIQQKTLPRQPRISVSVPTIYRWMKLYIESDYDIRALVPNSHKQGRKKDKFSEDLEQLMRETIIEMALDKKRLKSSVEDIQDEIFLRVQEANEERETVLSTPSPSTVNRRIQMMGYWERFASRRGKQEAYYASNQFGQIPEPKRPLDRVEIDHTPIDLIVVDEETQATLGRPILTCALDVKTRNILGYYLGFEDYSFFTVRECLYNSILPKGAELKERYSLTYDWLAYGVPRVIVIDNGKEFHSKSFDDACLQLGIVIHESPAYTPHFKAFIERVFGTYTTKLLKKLDGATFSNLRERGDYDSMAEAKITLRQLDQILHYFIVDIYNQRFHKGLQGIPARRWEAFVAGGFEPRLPASAHELSILLGAVEERKVHPDGIELHTLRYNSPELSTLRGRLGKNSTKIKYHPGDLSRIYAHDPFEQRYIEVPALAPDYTRGLSLWMHRVIRKNILDSRDEEDQQTRAETKRKIDDLVNQDLKGGKKRTRTKVGRWKTAGASAQTLNETVLPPPPPSPAREARPNLKLLFDANELENMGFSSDDVTTREDKNEEID